MYMSTMVNVICCNWPCESLIIIFTDVTCSGFSPLMFWMWCVWDCSCIFFNATDYLH